MNRRSHTQLWNSRTLVGAFIGLLVAGTASSASATMLAISGYYNGDTTDDRQITELGFTPDFVCITNETYEGTVCRSSSMASDETKPIYTGDALTSNMIQSFGSSYFEVGSSDYTNGLEETYHYIAMADSAGEMAVGSYTGNGSDDRSITGVGFQPDLVIVMGEGSTHTVWRSSNFSGDQATTLVNSNSTDDIIQAFESDGFQVGTRIYANDSGVDYHYVAFKAAAGRLVVSGYTGNGSDDRTITGVGYTPEWVVIKRQDSEEARQHLGSLGESTDESFGFVSGASVTNRIQLRNSDGFQVGSDADVNNSSSTYQYFAFARSSAALSVTLKDFGAYWQPRGVQLAWETSHEFNNLGFRLIRESRGRQADVNEGLLSGTSMWFSHVQSPAAGRQYIWTDTQGSERDHYWLVDVDMDGSETWHGPVDVEFPQNSWLSGSTKNRHAQRLTAGLGVGTQQEILQIDTNPANPAPGQRDTELRQWQIAAQPGIKIGVAKEGWIHITQAALIEAGLDPWVDPNTLGLMVDGEDVAMLVDGEEDGSLDADDSIAFYGRASTSRWSPERVYWLIPGHDHPARITREASPVEPPDTWIRTFASRAVRQERSFYFAALRNGPADNFFGAIVTSNGATEPLPMHRADANSPYDAQLIVKLQGITDVPHQVAVHVNDRFAGHVRFEGRDSGESVFDIPLDWLNDGENDIRLSGGAPMDISLVDHVELLYDRQLMPHDGYLAFEAEAGTGLALTGFEVGNVRVFDITEDAFMRELTVEHESAIDDGELYATASVGRGKRRLLAVAPEAYQSPAWVEPNSATALSQETQGADMIIITHPTLEEAAETLANHRRGEGLTVNIATTDMVYDAYGYGMTSPHAIKRFLSDAHTTWQTKPRYVLLLGDASFDPRNYITFFDAPNLIPTAPVDTEYMETASDLWYAQLDDDDKPDVAIGRLPVRTAEDANQLVSKIIAYEMDGYDAERDRLLMLSDEGLGGDFFGLSRTLIERLPSHLTLDMHLRAEETTDRDREDLADALEQEPALIHYLGHASVAGLRGDWLSARNVDHWPDVSPTLVVSMTCLTGFYHDVFSTSLTEKMLTTPQGGAVAVWASSGMEYPEHHQEFDAALMQNLTQGKAATIGDATLDAMRTTSGTSDLNTWHLFGDPAMRLTLTPPPPGALPGELLSGTPEDAQSVRRPTANLENALNDDHPEAGGCHQVNGIWWLLLLVGRRRLRKCDAST